MGVITYLMWSISSLLDFPVMATKILLAALKYVMTSIGVIISGCVEQKITHVGKSCWMSWQTILS